LWREPAILAHHHRELVILANVWREVTFPSSCRTNMDYKKFTGEIAKAIKRCPGIQALHQKDSLSQQGASSSGNPVKVAGTFGHLWAAAILTGSRDSPGVRIASSLWRYARTAGSLGHIFG
jgi:hypothetical protein